MVSCCWLVFWYDAVVYCTVRYCTVSYFCYSLGHLRAQRVLTYTVSPDSYEPIQRTECDRAGLHPRVRMNGIMNTPKFHARRESLAAAPSSSSETRLCEATLPPDARDARVGHSAALAVASHAVRKAWAEQHTPAIVCELRLEAHARVAPAPVRRHCCRRYICACKWSSAVVLHGTR